MQFPRYPNHGYKQESQRKHKEQRRHNPFRPADAFHLNQVASFSGDGTK
jgi:hypothetical protein